VKILAIDSSGLTASAAVYCDGVILACQTVNNKKTHSQTLLPMIEGVVEQSELSLDELDAIAVAEGPGSFTGLRIGAATVKGLCLAIDKPVIPVSTLAGLANNIPCQEGIICPIMDARRKQVYTAIYGYSDGRLAEVVEPRAMAVSELLTALLSDDERKIADILDADASPFIVNQDIMFVGDGIPVFGQYIMERAEEHGCPGGRIKFAPPHLRYQNSASVAVLAAELAERGGIIHADEFEPVYLRLSQAEREKLAREKFLSYNIQ